jgi:hypothetical protein
MLVRQLLNDGNAGWLKNSQCSHSNDHHGHAQEGKLFSHIVRLF